MVERITVCCYRINIRKKGRKLWESMIDKIYYSKSLIKDGRKTNKARKKKKGNACIPQSNIPILFFGEIIVDFIISKIYNFRICYN